MPSPATGFRNKEWNLGFLRQKIKPHREAKNQFMGVPQPKQHLLWGYQLVYKAWEEDAVCEDREKLKKSPQSLFPHRSSVTYDTSEYSLM